MDKRKNCVQDWVRTNLGIWEFFCNLFRSEVVTDKDPNEDLTLTRPDGENTASPEKLFKIYQKLLVEAAEASKDSENGKGIAKAWEQDEAELRHKIEDLERDMKKVQQDNTNLKEKLDWVIKYVTVF